MEAIIMELQKHVGENTLLFLQKESERYQRVLEYIKNNPYKEHMEGEIKQLVSLSESDSWTIDEKDSSRFSLASYQLEEDTYLYDYAVDFRREKNFHTRNIILTSANIEPIWENIFRFDEEYKKQQIFNRRVIPDTHIQNEVIKNTLKKYHRPYISYVEEPKNWLYPQEYQQTVNYYNMDGRQISETVLTDPKIVIMLSEDKFEEEGVYGKEKIEPWVKRYMNPEDDPVKLVEMLGHFGCSKEYQRLVKKL